MILIDSETGLLDSDISSVQLQTQLQLQQLQTQQLQAQLQAQKLQSQAQQLQAQLLQVQQMSSIGIPSKGVSKLRTSTAGPDPYLKSYKIKTDIIVTNVLHTTPGKMS